jgi:hypothetical protein
MDARMRQRPRKRIEWALPRYPEQWMAADVKLVLVFVGLHLVGFLMIGLLVLMFLRSETPDGWNPPDEDENDGGGGSDRVPPVAPDKPRPGGLPLPDAVPARVRLREPARLADVLPQRERRPAREPEREPVRRPV